MKFHGEFTFSKNQNFSLMIFTFQILQIDQQTLEIDLYEILIYSCPQSHTHFFLFCVC